MKITKEEILHVAHLARLEIDEASIEKFAVQIGNILDYVDQLRQVDTRGVKPTSHALALTNAFREDAEQAPGARGLAGERPRAGRRQLRGAEGGGAKAPWRRCSKLKDQRKQVWRRRTEGMILGRDFGVIAARAAPA